MDIFLIERLAAIAGLLLVSAFFAGAETALFSMSRASRESLTALTDPGSKRVLALLEHPRRLLVTLIVCHELVDVGSETGELQVAERRLIHNVFEFGDTTVGKVMTPADKVFSLPYEMPLGRMVESVAHERYSRVPIYRTVKAQSRLARKSPAN